MKTLEISGKLREKVGKKDTKKLRVEEKVPCVLYGGEEVVHFYVPSKDFIPLIYTPHVYILKLDIDGKQFDAVLQDIQFHPVKDNILHIDFLQIDVAKPITIGIPVKLNGFAKGVQDGGKLNLMARKLKVKGLLNNLPDQLEVDVTNVALGQTVKVRELSFDNIELMDPANAVVCNVKLTRAARGMEDSEEEGEEGEEGAEGAEGGEGGDAQASE